MRRPDEWDKQGMFLPRLFYVHTWTESITEVLTINAETGRMVGEGQNYRVMNEKFAKEEKILLHSTESTASKDDFGDDNFPYKCSICHSLCETNAPWVSTFPFDAEYSSDEELKSKALAEVLKCLKERGIIKFITVHIKDEDRNIDII